MHLCRRPACGGGCGTGCDATSVVGPLCKQEGAQRMAPQVLREDAAALEPWLRWVEGYARFFLACLRRWVRARLRTDAQPDQAARARADRLPCARLLCDCYLFKSLAEARAPPFSSFAANDLSCTFASWMSLRCKAQASPQCGSPWLAHVHSAQLAPSYQVVSGACGAPSMLASTCEGSMTPQAVACVQSAAAEMSRQEGVHHRRDLLGVCSNCEEAHDAAWHHRDREWPVLGVCCRR